MRKEDFKDLIKESLREVLKEERLNLYEYLTPSVSAREMKEIQKLYGKKPKYNKREFKDMTSWIMK